MKKTEIVNKLAEAHNLSKKDATAILDTLTGMIVEDVANGNAVTLTDFGTFKPVVRAARTFRVPSSGGMMDVPERKSVSFKAGRGFKNALNEKN